MPKHCRIYYQYVEKDTSQISRIWQVLHALIFFAISVNAFCLAYAFHDIFDGFSFQCILYAEPFIELQDIYLYPTTTEDFVNASTTLAPTSPTESNKVIFSSVVDDLNATSTTANGSETVSGKIINGEYWVFESNFKARVATDYRKTIFGHLHVCNVVLFHPLATFVLAIFATVMSIIYGKGGRGYDSTLPSQTAVYVYPMLMVSIIMTIISLIMFGMLYNGFQQFCSKFEKYTGTIRCSKDIKYFTRRQDNFGTDIFYELQMVCVVTSIISVVLWILQTVLCIMRIICAADFQLNMITVLSRRRRSLKKDEDLVQEYLRRRGGNVKQARISFEEPTILYPVVEQPKIYAPLAAEETLKKSFKGLKRVDSFDEDEESGDSTKTTQV